MTAQSSEILFYKGKKYHMATEPFGLYLETKDDLEFISPDTSCWRGYYGKWTIKDNKLYLTDLTAFLKDIGMVGIDYFFEGKRKVFADWFSGVIRVPQGEMLQYVHMGYESIFERDLILYFKDGILINEREIDNRDLLDKENT